MEVLKWHSVRLDPAQPCKLHIITIITIMTIIITTVMIIIMIIVFIMVTHLTVATIIIGAAQGLWIPKCGFLIIRAPPEELHTKRNHESPIFSRKVAPLPLCQALLAKP